MVKKCRACRKDAFSLILGNTQLLYTWTGMDGPAGANRGSETVNNEIWAIGAQQRRLCASSEPKVLLIRHSKSKEIGKMVAR